ncbi:helix-turn-helix transcriptional regulator [Micromonospora sp. DR5-3]|uniref:helix-turn-helix transcriptional regulator n=1 Tax=unclassified Micromonospora TaxID=2617518 RepID=UPI0021026A25|nr:MULTISPECIES: helix-turn-helix transcriptional regulator [unclassified Micromonospora]MCW3819575.1 helix-turn-helix transcriptional regulator [Micromonospora sp. DR5-3]
MDAEELASALRSWRDRLKPAAVGLPAGGRRRAPGLRRQEVATLAGLTVDYLARLEQGRASNPSPPVLEALSRTLRLSEAEHDHLFRVAGQASSRTARMNTHVTPGAQRLLDRLTDVPVMVLSASWHLVVVNRLGAALLGDLSAAPVRERNMIWRHFTGLPDRFFVMTAEERRALEAEAVADLRVAFGRYPNDRDLRALLRDLRRTSERFRELWKRADVSERVTSRKTIEHPEVGRLTLDCDVLTVAGTDLRLVVYTAESGSSDAGALALLATIGTQAM